MLFTLLVNSKIIEKNIPLERAVYLLQALTKINKRLLLHHISTEQKKLTFTKDDMKIELRFSK